MEQPQLKRHGFPRLTLPTWDVQLSEHSECGELEQLVSSGVRVRAVSVVMLSLPCRVESEHTCAMNSVK